MCFSHPLPTYLLLPCYFSFQVCALVTPCPYIAHILPTYCPHIARILPTHCPHIAHTLPTYCPHIAHILPAYCPHIAHILPTHCPHIARILPRYCPHIAHTLPTYCPHIARILPTHCPHTAHIFCCPVTPLPTYLLLPCYAAAVVRFCVVPRKHSFTFNSPTPLLHSQRQMPPWSCHLFPCTRSLKSKSRANECDIEVCKSKAKVELIGVTLV